MMVELLAGIKGDNVYLAYLPQLEKEYNYWMEGASGCKPGQVDKRVVRLKDGALLNRYFDESNEPRPEHYRDDIKTEQETAGDKNIVYLELRAADAGGWELSGRWRVEEKVGTSLRTLAMAPVDLNCLLYKLERVIARAKTLQGQDSVAETFRKKADARAYAIDKYCWNKSLNFYTDYNFVSGRQVNFITPAGIYPFCVYETKPDYMSLLARRVAGVIKDKLLKEGGLQSSGKVTGLDMDAPYGVASLQWMAIYGMDRCGQKELARDIALRWMKLNADVFKRSGKLLDRYNVADTASEFNNGVNAGAAGSDQTNGVLLKLAAMYGMPEK
jgi:alpha,alpha-trehalase